MSWSGQSRHRWLTQADIDAGASSPLAAPLSLGEFVGVLVLLGICFAEWLRARLVEVLVALALVAAALVAGHFAGR